MVASLWGCNPQHSKETIMTSIHRSDRQRLVRVGDAHRLTQGSTFGPLPEGVDGSRYNPI